MSGILVVGSKFLEVIEVFGGLSPVLELPGRPRCHGQIRREIFSLGNLVVPGCGWGSLSARVWAYGGLRMAMARWFQDV